MPNKPEEIAGDAEKAVERIKVAVSAEQKSWKSIFTSVVFEELVKNLEGRERVTPEVFIEIMRGIIRDLTLSSLESGQINPLQIKQMELQLTVETAQLAFSSAFAGAVNNIMRPDVIREPIKTINEVDELILEDVTKKILNIDWKALGLRPGTPINHDSIKATIVILLRSMQGRNEIHFQIDGLIERVPGHKEILRGIPSTRKKLILNDAKDRMWVTMMDEDLHPEEATFIRDYLTIKTFEAIINGNGLDLGRVFEISVPDIDELKRIGARAKTYKARRGVDPINYSGGN